MAPWALAGLILLLPLVAMQVSDQVDWDETDFIVMGIMLFGACGAFELAATVDYLFGYDATTGVVADWMYERVTEAYVADPAMRAFFEAYAAKQNEVDDRWGDKQAWWRSAIPPGLACAHSSPRRG